MINRMNTNIDLVRLYKKQLEHLQRINSVPTWLKSIRESNFETYKKLGFPTKKDENWRYFDLSPIASHEFKLPPSNSQTIDSAKIQPLKFYGDDCYLLVYVNGHFQRDYSNNYCSSNNIVINDLHSSILKSDDFCEKSITKYSQTCNDAFTSLNLAFLNDGAYIRIPDNTILDKPIHILNYVSDSAEDCAVFPHNLIVVGDNCEVEILESFDGLPSLKYFSNTVTKIAIGNNSNVNHCKLQRESKYASHIANQDVYIDGSSRYVSTTITLGGQVSRNNISTYLDNEYAECTLNGLYIGTDKRLIDNHTLIDHAKANCNSYELFKGILCDNSAGVFNGKIFVHQAAQKTDAKQTNRVLLLSDDAKINTKPELEIYADDVKCTHGATIGQLDEEALFYLKARGITKRNAYALLTRAFANEALQKVSQDSIRDLVAEYLNAIIDETPAK